MGPDNLHGWLTLPALEFLRSRSVVTTTSMTGAPAVGLSGVSLPTGGCIFITVCAPSRAPLHQACHILLFHVYITAARPAGILPRVNFMRGFIRYLAFKEFRRIREVPGLNATSVQLMRILEQDRVENLDCGKDCHVGLLVVREPAPTRCPKAKIKIRRTLTIDTMVLGTEATRLGIECQVAASSPMSRFSLQIVVTFNPVPSALNPPAVIACFKPTLCPVQIPIMHSPSCSNRHDPKP